jgi:hypothetical protein
LSIPFLVPVGERFVSHYRLYLLDDRDHFVRGLDLSCRDDLDAKLAAELFRPTNAVELWQGPRLVAQLGKRPAEWPRAA